MDDTDDLGGVLAFQHSELLSGELKNFLWDSTDGDPYSLSGPEPEKDVLMDFMNPSMSPSSSESSIAHVDENKTMVMAAAYAAGLNKGGIRRAAFSMGDLQALQPADSGEFCSKPQPASTPLATVPEGQPAVITSLPSGAMLQPQQYVLVPVSSITSDAMGRNSTPTQLASMSIEEIEAQLCRTREAAAAGVSAGMDHQGLQIHTQGSTYYNVPGASPIKSEPQTTTFQPGQVITVMPRQVTAITTTAPMVTQVAAVGTAPTPLGGLRRAKSALELRQPSRAGEDVTLNLMLQQQQSLDKDDGMVRIGKLTVEERRQKILRYRQKRYERNFKKKIKYVCRKTLADSRPRVRGRFARNTDEEAKMPQAVSSK